LTIGLPLVAGLNLRQFAGVLAHEFGHFTQGFECGSLTSSVASTPGLLEWSMSATHGTRTLEEWGLRSMIGGYHSSSTSPGWRSGFRLLLAMLMYLGHGIGCFMLRQMEYDADSYEIKLAGSAAFEDTMRRFHVLGHLLGPSYKNIRTSWNLNSHLPDNFPPPTLSATRTSSQPQRRNHLENTMGLTPAGLLDTHPSNGDLIDRAREANEPGQFQLDAPTAALFSNFGVVSKQVTLLHYADDLGLPLVRSEVHACRNRTSRGIDR